MQAATLAALLRADESPDEFTLVRREISVLCRGNLPAATLLSKLIYWTGVAESAPEKCGWIYKTAADLDYELGLTRRGYEKARRFLVDELGVMQYRRGGVHGKMHWRVELPEVARQIFEKVKKIPMPSLTGVRNKDKDGWLLDADIPVESWNRFLQMREDEGKPVSKKYKAALRRRLKELRKQGADIEAAIETAVANKWGFFQLPPKHRHEADQREAQRQQDEQLRRALEADRAAKEAEAARAAKPPPDKTQERQDIMQNTADLLKSLDEAIRNGRQP